MTKQQAYDPVTADFIGKLATSMPPMPGSVMQEWKPAELRRTLMRAIAVGPKGTHVPTFPIAGLHRSVYKCTPQDLLAWHTTNNCLNFFDGDEYLKRIFAEVFASETPKQVKRSRGFVGIFAEFIPEELREFMRENQYIPPGMYHWAREIGLRPVTQYDALHLPSALPNKSPWYTDFRQAQKIIPMIVPTPVKSFDPERPFTAWHADRLAAMLRIQPLEHNKVRKNRFGGARAEDVVLDLLQPDTIMVFWA